MFAYFWYFDTFSHALFRCMHMHRFSAQHSSTLPFIFIPILFLTIFTTDNLILRFSVFFFGLNLEPDRPDAINPNGFSRHHIFRFEKLHVA